MTEKEKAEAYDEAIERAKKLYGNGIIEEIFPELKEDDTERIRKNCIHFLELQKQHHAATFEIEECIDWLETQGKNSTDKTKPSFKVGDWIITPKNKVLQITSIDDTSYCDEQCRFWTIEDGKDGDVLALSWLEDKNLWEKIIIFKKYHSEGVKGICSMPCVEGYGITFKNGKMAFTEKVPYYSKTWTCNLHPATKEQRDLLFQKIKEAGYEWDSEKKELKKSVEPKFKVGDKITNSFRKYVGASGSQVIISEITDDKYIFTDGRYIFISNQDSWELAPDKNPKFNPETLKTYNDINIGDTVYIWGRGDSSVDETTITEKYDDRGHWNLKFSNGCVGRALKNGTSSTMGMYGCLVYSDKEAVIESINERIKILSNIKI